ncbi:MAG: ricin-type beta-trefoil lectin domain protein [Lewinellaceae bacterium]|nr:ricin-type beta-trefoil lectin domain protein [Lewinellaceae bacterium]
MKYEIKFETLDVPGIRQRAMFLLLLLLAGTGFALAQSPIYIAHLDRTYLVLQATNNSQSNGTPIVLGERSDGNTTLHPQQVWYYDNATHTIRLIANQNKCIARKGQQLLNDQIVVADYNANSDLQRWVLEDHKVKLLSNKNLCIGLSDANFTLGGAAVLQEVSNVITEQQKWFFREKPAHTFTADGQLHRVNSPGDTYIEFAIPDPCPYQYLNITARGGDGGNRTVNNNVKAKGGEGATMGGLYKIGTGYNQLRPGTTIRLVIGRAGNSRLNNANAIGSSGGGGTGVIYEKREVRTSLYYYPWHVLAIAGGGGGAYADCCAVSRDGDPANNITKINIGQNHFAAERDYEYGGWREEDFSYTGSGFREDSDPLGCTGCVQNGTGAGYHIVDGLLYPTGGRYTYNDYVGAFGFGGGGIAGNLLTRAGSGGGYNGASVGSNGFAGGGAGSWIDQYALAPDALPLAIKNGVTESPIDGYVEYQFTNAGPVTRDLGFEYHKGTESSVLQTGNWNLLWQYDGNLVLYGPGYGNGAWTSHTDNKGTDLYFQGDGNLVIYQSGNPVFASNTANDQHSGKGGRKLVLTPEGSLYIIDQDGNKIWQGR